MSEKKVVLIIDASSGIGQATARLESVEPGSKFYKTFITLCLGGRDD
jgi:NADP-dependent 3-hydroxy acid dehydrogenase YdfG